MFGPIELTDKLQYHALPTGQPKDVGEHRNFKCSFYNACLRIAAGNKWQSFTCKYCPSFDEEYQLFDEETMVH